MPPKIYKTSDMESSLQKMVERNHTVLMFIRYTRDNFIPFRFDKVPGLKIRIAKYKGDRKIAVMALWRSEGGVLTCAAQEAGYRLPESDALLMVQCPVQYRDFELYAEHTKDEVVIYRPPTWDMHIKNLNSMYLDSEAHRKVLEYMRSIVDRPLSDRLLAANSAFGGEGHAVFEILEVAQGTKLSPQQVKNCLKDWKIRNHYARYHCYTPRIRPDHNRDLGMVFDLLESMPSIWRGQRMLRFNNPGIQIAGFKKYMNILIWEGYVSKHPPVHVFKDGYIPMDYVKIDGVSESRKKDWIKIRDFVDSLPEYPIS